MKPTLVSLLFAMSTLACMGGEQSPASMAAARDSAGVSIVSSDSPLWTAGQEWTISEAPVVEIGKQGSDTLHQFAGVTSIARLSDGQIVVANRRPPVLRLYSAEGRYVRDIGRAGDGPGEYRYVTQLARLPGDSILVTQEVGPNPIFSKEGEYGRSVILENAPRDFGERAANGIAPPPLRAFNDGSFLSIASVTGGEAVVDGRAPQGVSADSLEFHHYSPTGARLHSLGVFDVFERFVAGSEQYVRTATPERIYTVSGDRLITGNGRTFEIRSIATDGTLMRIVRVTTPATPLSPDSIANRKAKRLATATTPEQRAQTEKIYGIMDFPDSLPRFDDIVADDSGGLWVKEYNTVSAVRWYVFDASGRWLGAVNLPPRFTLEIVSGDLIYGVALDDDDVESIRVYRIRRGSV